MTQRNPMNDRYQTEGNKGQTRKSAATAKPKTPAASSVYVKGSSSTANKGGFFARAQAKSAAAEAKREAERKRQVKRGNKATGRVKPEYYNVPTAEYRAVRRTWWILIAVAIAGMAASYLVRNAFPDNIIPSTVVLIISYIAIFAALFLDLFKTRKIRQRYQAECEAALKSKAGKRAARERAEEEARLLAEEEQREAARQERKQAFFAKLGFKKKPAASQTDTPAQND